LIQEKNKKDLEPSTFKVKSTKKPEQNELEDMIFAHKIAKHTKTCCAVIAKDLRTIGICAGQTNRINAVEFALQKVCDSAKNSIMALDGDTVSPSIIQLIAQNRIVGIIQPNCSDKALIEANKLNVSIVTTNIRHFKN
ncbi:bifunctional phosphoribosylaminoimidazolecarboxamide formyltransferase/IMP cyclohydrolase, partial [bacterium]|nr:bifunctional phosphoribosylaminoimidazolecarboxamide formyltransferase/IMP cyclohydrolase [bacterium]